jgi:hypothetical protein
MEYGLPRRAHSESSPFETAFSSIQALGFTRLAADGPSIAVVAISLRATTDSAPATAAVIRMRRSPRWLARRATAMPTTLTVPLRSLEQPGFGRASAPGSWQDYGTNADRHIR